MFSIQNLRQSKQQRNDPILLIQGMLNKPGKATFARNPSTFRNQATASNRKPANEEESDEADPNTFGIAATTANTASTMSFFGSSPTTTTATSTAQFGQIGFSPSNNNHGKESDAGVAQTFGFAASRSLRATPNGSSTSNHGFGFASATRVNTVTHHDITCDSCQCSPIVGVRYRCSMCPNFDLCEPCLTKKEDSSSQEIHDPMHIFYRCHNLNSYKYPTIVNRANICHHGITCSGCGTKDPRGYLYKCQVCVDANFCESCEARGFHNVEHARSKIAKPSSESMELAKCRAELELLKSQMKQQQEGSPSKFQF